MGARAVTEPPRPSLFAHPEHLADPTWVADHAHVPGVRIIDCADAEDFARAHLPGAVRLGLHPWLKAEGSPHVLHPDALARRMSELGVSTGTTVVTYDGGTGWLAARLWWVLRHSGHEDVRVLNGGWRRWVREGRPVSVDEVEVVPATFQARRNPSVIIELEELRQKLGQEGVQVVNVLPPAMYRGEANPFDNARVGHLPGSVNVPNESFSGEAGFFESAGTIRQAFENAGLSPERETILHCQAGVRSAHACLALTLAGWPRVRVYDASLAEWANREDTPLVTPA